MFEKHQHLEQFLRDLSQRSRRSTCSARSQNFFTTTWTKQIFEFYEKSEKKKKMSWLQCHFRNRDHLMQLLEKFAVFAESHNTPEDQLWFYFNPWLCHWEEFQSRTKTRFIWKTGGVFQGEAGAYESETRETWEPSDDSLKMLCTRKIRVDEKEVMLFDRITAEKMDGYSYESWTATERQILVASFECWWAPKAFSTATRICRSIETMHHTARHSLGWNAAMSETDTSRTSLATSTRSGNSKEKN